MGFKDILNFIPVVGPLVGGAIDNITGAVQQDKQNKANMELAKYSWDRNVEMWHMNNSYNSPINQMKRLSEAGLNPNLVYGNGSVVGNTSGSAPEFESPEMKMYKPDVSSGISQSVQSFYQNETLKADVANKSADTELKKYQGFKVLAETDTQKLSNTERRMRNEILRSTMKDLIAREGLTNDEIKSRLALSGAQIQESIARRNLSYAEIRHINKQMEEIGFMIEFYYPEQLSLSRQRLSLDVKRTNAEIENLFKQGQLTDANVQQIKRNLLEQGMTWAARYGITEQQYKQSVIETSKAVLDRDIKQLIKLKKQYGLGDDFISNLLYAFGVNIAQLFVLDM